MIIKIFGLRVDGPGAGRCWASVGCATTKTIAAARAKMIAQN
jgi:hypothetical protein